MNVAGAGMIELWNIVVRSGALTRALLLVMVLTLAGEVAPETSLAGALPQAPGRPSSGFGSAAKYISQPATEMRQGDRDAGEEVFWYVPARLRDGHSAPAIVFLHGFSALSPALYRDHIEHLTRQGYVVIYPQFQRSARYALSDTDQNVMLARAIASTRDVIRQLGNVVQEDRIYLYGHSLGGLMVAGWTAAGGPKPAAILAANPSLGGGVPQFVEDSVEIVPIDIESDARETTAPIVILTGSDDGLAPPTEAVELFGYLSRSSSRALYMARTDGHGLPPLNAVHLAPLSVPATNTLDYRFYEAGLDALLAGRTRLTFDMGQWSDGTPVAAPVLLLEQRRN